MCRGPLEQLPAERGIAYMGFSFIVTSIVLVICSSYRIHIKGTCQAGAEPPGATVIERIREERSSTVLTRR